VPPDSTDHDRDRAPAPGELDDAGAPAGAPSGSIEVRVSGQTLPAPPEPTAPPGAAVAIDPGDSRPIAAGRPPADSDTRGKRIVDATRDALDAGVSRIGSGIGTIGGGMSRLGEGVSKLGDLSRGVPVVGASVVMLGEGLTHVGDSLHGLPEAARTRRGRLLIRSMIVGFVLVATWIAVIVALQLHGNDTPDFRPYAERILVDLSKGAIGEVYEQASPRFQEMVRKEQFIDDMTDLTQTVGGFREITAVNDALVTTGSTGRIGRVSLTAAYAKATCKVSVSLHYDQERWKLLGIGVELPPELKISPAQREERVKACQDPMDAKHCDVHVAADAILRLLRDRHADQVWEAASPVFQKQEHKAKFVQLQDEHADVLGRYRRIIAVSEAKVIDGTSATFDTLAEFERASGVRVVFGMSRPSKLARWTLSSLKIALPMPRSTDDPVPGSGSGAPPRQPAPTGRASPRDAGAR
jgi:hypothetical protein